MKKLRPLLAFTLCCLLASCFKDEPLNAECDIEQAYVHTGNYSDFFFSPTDTIVNVPSDVNEIVFNIKEGADLTNMAPILKLTEGATVEPENGSAHDFSNGKSVTYKVTSQDGQWNRTYNIIFRTKYPVSKFDFENYRLTKGANRGEYYEWSDISEDGTWLGNWATGNAGFNISMGTAAPEEYPTSPVTDGYSGSAVKLETRSTGALGEMVNMGIAAGNLFLGYFDVSKALTNTMQATNFGTTFNRKPLRMRGFYKYKPGSIMQDKYGNTIEGRTDIGDIYAVFYKNTDNNGNSVILHGDDVKTHENIIAIAQLDEVKTTDEWTEFNIEFAYSTEPDADMLLSNGYNLAVVFTSSIEGASFCGAIGSTLYIDEVEIICEETEQ